MPMKDKKTKQKKKKKGRLSTILLAILLLAGIGIIAYPTVSDYWNSFHQSQIVANYDETIANLDETDYEALFAAADAYNEHLLALSYPFLSYDELKDEYESVLDVTGTGVIGYVTIAKIDVELPIYHGTSESILNTSAGHLEGSTLPIGGKSRHAVISAHRGLPSAKLFTNLDKLEKGDTFTITVLNELLTYEVDQILIVEPDQMSALDMVQGKDYVTLLTCTPYGINTHRMMVRGHRIENLAGEINIRAEATKISAYVVIPAVAIPILFALLVILLVVYRKKPKITLKDIQEIGKSEQANEDAADQPDADESKDASD